MAAYYTDAPPRLPKPAARVPTEGKVFGRATLLLLRVAWATLPLTAGPAASAGLRGWSDGPRVLAEVLLWAAWSVGLLAVLTPRPETLTALRVVAPASLAVAMAVAVGGAPSTIAKVGALAATFVCAVLASGHDVAFAAANARAYGDEQRFPLRLPPALYLGPLPVARAIVAAGIAAGPLLLADGRIVLGVVALLVGVPLVALLLRALHGLSGRWAVLVPAGVVIVDPLTLADPVLFLRERIVRLQTVPQRRAPGDALDLRLGAVVGTVSMRFDEPADVMRAPRARRGAEAVRTTEIWFAVVRRERLLATAARRRLRVA